MTFEPENALEKALLRAAKDAAARPEFYRLLMSANLFAAGERRKDGDVLRLAIVKGPDGDAHPIFTARSRLEGFVPKNAGHFSLVGRDLFASARGAQFVLNPGSEIVKRLTPDEIDYWLAQLVGPRMEDAARRSIAAPARHPPKLVKALGVLFVNRRVHSARLAEVRRTGDQPRLLLAVEADSSWRRLAHEIALAVDAIGGFDIELIRLNAGDSRNPLTRQLLAIPPFFERKHFLEQKEPAS